MLLHASVAALFSALLMVGQVQAADTVPTDIMQPGTQPKEVSNFESPGKCDNCHGGYDQTHEPAFLWRGSAMGNAGRDPIFWATLAIAEQDFDGAGDLCIRCHSAAGWYAGRSTPTDGSGLLAGDSDGIDCDTCHKATNPNNSEHAGVQNPGFEAFDPDTGEGYYGSGMLSVWGGSDKLGPYSDAEARHQFMQSQFHRGNICGSCHDVSNPAVGDLAPNNGAQVPLEPGTFNGIPNALDPNQDPTTKAAFNNPPYAYGIVERTFSEWKSTPLSTMSVTEFGSLPEDLQVPGGALDLAASAAALAGGAYEDGTPRTFSCQSCHMRPALAQGCNKNPPLRADMPTHDLTGGNYWIWPLIQYQDAKGTLRLGGGLTQTQIDAMAAGKLRALAQLESAANIEVVGDSVKVTNLTGHKLISGYPEGRRMWLNMKWFDGNGALIREDGKYGPLVDGAGKPVTVVNPATGLPVQVQSILDLEGTNTRIYEAHYAMTQAWATKLIDAAGYDPAMPLSFDRNTGAVSKTLGDLKAGNVDHTTYEETFHFVLNNYVAKDNRIPPYQMSYDESRKRNALPVPETQFGNPGPGGVYDYWDMVPLNPPSGAVRADITLYYQGTSWEYVQFLWKANTGANAFLGQEGVNMFDAWLNADPAAPMVPPVVMATTTWGTAPALPEIGVASVSTGRYVTTGKGKSQTTTFEPTTIFAAGDEVVLRATLDRQVAGATVAFTISGPATASVTSGPSDANGVAEARWKTSAPNRNGQGGTTPGSYTAATSGVTAQGYDWDGVGTSVTFNVQ